MHKSSMRLMREALDRHQQEAARVLDVGSLNVNGTYRDLVEKRGWVYTGLDVVPGPNVDEVAADPFRYPFEDGVFDVVISGQTMEHVTAIWEWVPELVRLLRPGGLLAVVTVLAWPYHPYPVDCWRILPDGMQYLFDCTGRLRHCDIHTDGAGTIIGSAFKD